jgi:triacylglycerol lipase
MTNPALDTPVVLVHGIFGFDQLTLGGIRIADYFRLIPHTLRAQGNIVPEPPQLNPAGSVAERAQDLKNYLQSNSDVAGKKVNIIAHSMGGLDSRYLISKLDMADRVLSLTTIGTPHHGSPIADMVIAHTNPILNSFVKHLGVDIKGVSDLTTDACRGFNNEVLDSPNIHYRSVAGQFEPPRILGEPLGLLGLTHEIIRGKEGANDGLVSVESARFGQDPNNWTFLGTWAANHFRLVNWGMNIVPSPSELFDETIVDNYKALVG